MLQANRYDSMFAGGRFVPTSSRDSVDIISPITEEVIGNVTLAAATDVDVAIAAAREAFDHGPWPRMPAAGRAAALRQLADRLDERLAELIDLSIDELGTPIGFAEGYTGPMPAINLRMAAALADEYPFEEERVGPSGRSLVLREPVGVVAAIPPWNGPLTLGTQKIGPALAAGCTCVLKAPILGPLSVYLLAELAADILPPGVLNVLVADLPASEHLVAHPGVDKVSFTGSTAVGRRIGAVCGGDIRRMTLELGGKSAAVILEDADLDVAIPGIVGSSVAMMMGEICTAQARILAPRPRYQEIVDRLASQISELVVGDPRDRTVAVGPLVTREHRARVERYISLGREDGAEVHAGGGRPRGLERGWYVEPTLFAGVDNTMRIAREEIFGPVAVVIPHDGLDDAIAIANDSPFGLSGTVWTQDGDAAIDVARRVRTGTFAINTYTVDPTTPFGGFKQSGVGREMGREGLDAFIEFKSIALEGPSLV